MTIELDNNLLWGMVAYTDGGCRPNPGPAGAGGHIYAYPIEEEAPNDLTDKEVNVKIKSMLYRNPEMRASANSTPLAEMIKRAQEMGYFIKPAKGKPVKFSDGDTGIRYALTTTVGYVFSSKDGVVSSAANQDVIPVTPKHIITFVESSSNQHTNNYVEIKSALNAMQLARKHGVKRLHIITDSEYTVKGLSQWCAGWANRNWTTLNGEPVKNRELWETIYSLYLDLKQSGMIITLAWIKGHANHPGNNQADHLATIGVFRSMSGEDNLDVRYYTPKDYWEPKRDRHPLMSLKRMYFSREAERNTPGVYYMADPGKDDNLIGKPIPEAVFAVVRMKEPIPLIDSIWQAQGRYGQDFNATMMIKMEDVYEPYAFRLISDYGSSALLRAQTRNPGQPNRGNHLILPDKRQITIEKTPIGITMRAIDSINALENILEHFLLIQKEGEDSLHNNLGMKLHDMTESLYDLQEKKVQGEIQIKKTLKKDLIVGQKTFSVTLDVSSEDKERTLTLPLRLGMDLPDRNNLKQLEVFDPKVTLITWRESSNSLRYAAVLQCEEDIAIWSNFYADRLMLKD